MKRLALAALSVAIPLAAQMPEPRIKRPEKPEKEVTQTLEAAKELPQFVAADTHRLSFYVTPLSAKGLLSQQVRDAMKWLFRETRGEMVVKLRAFVAGSGDMRRVPTLVSDMFAEKRLALPALTVLQAGGLPLEGAQVLFEATAQEKKEINREGLVFIGAQQESVAEPLQPLAPLAAKALGRLEAALKAAGAGPKNVVRAACFTSSLDGIQEVRQRAASLFPVSALAFIQTQRAPSTTFVSCEATAAAVSPVRRVAFTGAQLAFGFEPADARLAFERFAKTLQQAGAGYNSLAALTIYPISSSVAALVEKTEPQFFGPGKAPPMTVLPFEALSSVDAAFGLDAIAIQEP